jgi:release factor glutamine methyltransferase
MLPAVDLYYLLSHAVGRSREFILAHPEHRVGLRSFLRWRRMRRRRLRGVPAAYITGEKEFYGLRFKVNRHTLIPRPETELLVDEILRRNPASLLDMGTGCGCIAVAAAYHLPSCSVTAVDVSKRALAVAALNSISLLGKRITFFQSDYFSSLRSQQYELIASNPPYVREGDDETLSPEVAAYEPLSALYGGKDGLHAYRIILNNARDFLMPQGVLVLEISPEISQAVQHMAKACGYRIEQIARDLGDHVRMLVLASG